MPGIEERLQALGLVLPQPPRVPPGITLPFPWVNIRGDRAFLSGHGPQEPDGSLAGPFGSAAPSASMRPGSSRGRWRPRCSPA